jgi:hypothetical protein
MATRQQRLTKKKARSTNHTTIAWLVIVIALIGLVFYFGFIKVD